MLHRIKLAIAQLGEESTMANYDVTIKEIVPRYVASVRDILESYNYEGRLWHYMMKETADQKSDASKSLSGIRNFPRC